MFFVDNDAMLGGDGDGPIVRRFAHAHERVRKGFKCVGFSHSGGQVGDG